MTLQELFKNPQFHKLNVQQRLVACGLIVYAKDGQGIADPQYLQNKPLLSGVEEIEDALVVIERSLPVKFFAQDGKRLYVWER